MTNLEYYKDEIEERFKQLFKSFTDTSSLACALDETYQKHRKQKYESMFTWYFEEHKEPIKLTQFEYDLLEYYTNVDNSWNGRILHENYAIRYMCDKGYLKNVDLNMTFREVLDNCEVIE